MGEGGRRDRFDDVVISVYAHHLEVTSDAEASVEGLASSWGTTTEQVLASPHVLLGPTARIIETLQERRERFGISHVVFLGADLENAEPIVKALAGS